VTVKLGSGGKLWATYRALHTSDTAKLVLDVTGYFTPDTSGATYHPVTPGRVLDSRTGLGSGTFQMGVPRSFQVTGHAGVPSNATAVTGTLTVASATGAGYVSLTPTSQAKPTSSTLNFPTHDVRATGVTVKLGSGGKLWATYRALHTSDTAKLVFDVTGYFTP
jgi:hypothetical protein